MFLKLPLCPHCGAIYSYIEVKRLKGINSCHHCKKRFEVKKAFGRIVLLSVVCLILTAVNILLMLSTKDLKIVGVLAAVDLIAVCISFLLFPFTVKFRAIKTTKSQKKLLKNGGN